MFIYNDIGGVLKSPCPRVKRGELNTGSQKDRPYQSDFYRVGFNAIPRQAREQDSFDTPPMNRCGMCYLIPNLILIAFGIASLWTIT
ncbi:putative uncharacterized protein [Parabacteroides johnsonii CAG:246]|nr:putative uncharacterized protein [Parabacteroides johnsonii CAG:246]